MGQAHAWYSREADESFGHAIYEREDGTRVDVTEVRSDGVKKPTSLWPDLKYVGLVGRCVETSKRSITIWS